MNQRLKSILLRTARIFFLLCLTFYLGICGFMGFSQRSLIYRQQIYSPAEVADKARAAGLERWANSDGQSIGFKKLSPTQPADGTVLLFYGNASTATASAHYADDIQKAANFDVFILEYPGYEDRPGDPTQEKLFTAADEALQMLPTNQPIYVVGESLGSGVASYLAGTHPDKISGMILISPFNSLTAVAQYQYPWLPVWFLLVDRFPSETYLRHYRGKVGVTVDGNDTVVPEKFGLRLYETYSGPKKLWLFPDGTHCQITEQQQEFWKAAVAYLRLK
ncbi:MAG TPA: alpha/beta fold hydrolase [Verrucomicrobiae bacterium]|nr:alpha/beta fold hydrolase [Verrucomicrobiae bacterium]